MAPILPLLLSLLIIQDAAPAEAAPAPAAAPAEVEYPIPPGAPEDDYGLVAWCYGALDGHMKLYDKVLPEVQRIENEIAKIPGAPPADMQGYKDQHAAGKDTLKLFRGAMEAAEKASAKPIAAQGADALKRGNTVWFTIRDTKDKKYLAREWMSWGLPGRCLPTAQRLQAKSNLFGQALTYNAKAPAEPAPPAEAAAAPADFIGAAVSDAQQPVEGTPVEPQVADPADQSLTPGDIAPADAEPEDAAAPDLRGPQD
ncbi:MAG: hypothetical protein K0R83_2377 [Caulobacter sp.]|jgi:hypothetical protein|nr:hypothetical protein [Caulobacter sp.]